jgi:hypothetical protein
MEISTDDMLSVSETSVSGNMDVNEVVVNRDGEVNSKVKGA